MEATKNIVQNAVFRKEISADEMLYICFQTTSIIHVYPRIF